MSITYAKVVGEISAGSITIVLNPDETGSDAVNNTASEMTATLPLDLVPTELRTPDTDIWFAVEKKEGETTTTIRKIFPMISDEIPGEYYSWLKENGLEPKT